MSYNDLRKGRFSESNRIYFVTTVTHGRNNLFLDLRSARAVIQTMRHLDSAEYVHSLSWVVMPDHLHWLFQLNDKGSLSDVMKRMKAISARTVNQLLNRKGQVWQKSYHDHALRRDEDIKQLSRYIIANPLRAGLVDDIGKYPHWDAIWLNATLLSASSLLEQIGIT
jgi:REP element-mobilizing transposase RayT